MSCTLSAGYNGSATAAYKGTARLAHGHYNLNAPPQQWQAGRYDNLPRLHAAWAAPGTHLDSALREMCEKGELPGTPAQWGHLPTTNGHGQPLVDNRVMSPGPVGREITTAELRGSSVALDVTGNNRQSNYEPLNDARSAMRATVNAGLNSQRSAGNGYNPFDFDPVTGEFRGRVGWADGFYREFRPRKDQRRFIYTGHSGSRKKVRENVRQHHNVDVSAKHRGTAGPTVSWGVHHTPSNLHVREAVSRDPVATYNKRGGTKRVAVGEIYMAPQNRTAARPGVAAQPAVHPNSQFYQVAAANEAELGCVFEQGYFESV